MKAVGNLDKVILSGIQKLGEGTQMQKGQYTELISGKVRISAKVISPPVLGHVVTWAKDCGVSGEGSQEQWRCDRGLGGRIGVGTPVPASP